MNIVCADHAVALAVDPATIGRHNPRADDLEMVLTLVDKAPTLAALHGLRSFPLTRLSPEVLADFHFGTPDTGVVVRPVDVQGRHLETGPTRESLMHVTSVALMAVGKSHHEAATA